ncbi:MAG: dienelactone hydrolase family protein, partial [Candidatus Latescibacteria bacterium]|nr:dienelactone hydrolase family protein [Candidatus Latescibacterota bacterium]
FRNSGEFEDSEHDVEAGLSYLYREGFRSVALVGHSFGGAVVIRVATRVSMVRTVVTLASQSSGADGVADLGVDCSILLLHGTDDPIVPHGCSQYLHELAQAEKKLLLCPGADHFFEPLGEIVQQRIREWIVRELNPDH